MQLACVAVYSATNRWVDSFFLSRFFLVSFGLYVLFFYFLFGWMTYRWQRSYKQRHCRRGRSHNQKLREKKKVKGGKWQRAILFPIDSLIRFIFGFLIRLFSFLCQQTTHVRPTFLSDTAAASQKEEISQHSIKKKWFENEKRAAMTQKSKGSLSSVYLALSNGSCNCEGRVVEWVRPARVEGWGEATIASKQRGRICLSCTNT